MISHDIEKLEIQAIHGLVKHIGLRPHSHVPFYYFTGPHEKYVRLGRL